MTTPTAHEKKTALKNLSDALGAAETALEGADLDGLRSATEHLARVHNDRVFVHWHYRCHTLRDDLSRRADRLLPRLGDEIRRREEEAREEAEHKASAVAKADPSDENARALTDAAVAVAHATSEIVDSAERARDGYLISTDDMHQLRALLGAWSRAGERLLQHIRETAGQAA